MPKTRISLLTSKSADRERSTDIAIQVQNVSPAAPRRRQALMGGFAVGMTAGADGGTGLSAGDGFTFRAAIVFICHPTSTPIMGAGLSFLFDCRGGAHELASRRMMMSPLLVPLFLPEKT